MNKRKNAIIGIGCAIVVLLLLFPPWYLVSRGSHTHAKLSHGYHFLFSPPCCSPHIDLVRYLVPVGVVCLMVLLACLELKEEHRREIAPDKSR
ncbi:MAG TPA: hypothetical protein VII85_07980 [Candidatus Krumholzibacteriaceae bacterium]